VGYRELFYNDHLPLRIHHDVDTDADTDADPPAPLSINDGRQYMKHYRVSDLAILSHLIHRLDILLGQTETAVAIPPLLSSYGVPPARPAQSNLQSLC
jgi:hypothetical protein